MARSLQFYGDGISFRVVFSQPFGLRVLPGGACLVQPNGCQREGFWEVVGHVMSPFDLSRTLLVGGGLLVPCSLLGTPCCKTTYANGYYGVWPGWTVSVSVLHLTVL